MSREYPDYPRVGVGAVVLYGDRVLLVRRGGQPSAGRWSLPGGLVELGETTEEALRRELQEECAIDVKLLGLAGVIDRIVHDHERRIRYHYVLVDYAVEALSDAVKAGSDAAEATWVNIDRVHEMDVTDGVVAMIERALAVRGAATA